MQFWHLALRISGSNFRGDVRLFCRWRRYSAVRTNFSNSGAVIMKVGIACDHGGFPLKSKAVSHIQRLGHVVCDEFGAHALDPQDDYPDFIVPLAVAVAEGRIERGIALCGSGVGASIAASKVPGARAAVIFEAFSARQGVEDDDMNVLCLGARVVGPEYALELVTIFLAAEFSGAERHSRRLRKVQELEVRAN
jgi:ribose 5-phosphate isomerase B